MNAANLPVLRRATLGALLAVSALAAVSTPASARDFHGHRHGHWVYGPARPVVAWPRYGHVVYHRPAWATIVTVGAIGYLLADGIYYREHPAGGWQVVPPPQAVVDREPIPAVPKQYVYPRAGQGADQQSSDEWDCHRWAAGQSGYDPSAAATGQGAVGSASQRDGYARARSACLEGRGYTVR